MPKGIKGFQKGNINWNMGLPSEKQPGYKGGLCKNLKLYKKEYMQRPEVKKRAIKSQRKYYENNKIKISQKNHLNLLKQVIYNKKRRHLVGISKKYNSENNISYTKEYRKIHRQKYKYSFKQAGELSIKTIQQVYEDNIKQYGTLTCYLCLGSIEFRKDHLEHKTPLSRGGTNEYNNLAIACQKCNCKKHTKTETEYREENLL